LKPFHYTGCGLSNAYLLNGYSFDDDGNLFIEDIHGLHKAIGLSLVYKQTKLKASEIRFMRYYLDWSQKTLGNHLGVDHQSVMRWESSKTLIPKPVERLLKAIFYEYIYGDQRFVDIIDEISDIDNDRVEKDINLTHTDVWEAA